jgi:ATP-dependent RNA helicase DDX47/RRP3
VEDPAKGAEEPGFRELGVCESLIETMKQMGWQKPTAIQRESLPYALQGRDVIGLAETGSGKTGAFAIPVIQRLLQAATVPTKQIYCVVLCPTRELAFQIGEQFGALGGGIGLRVSVIVGGVDTMSQAISLAKRPHVVVGTPGRLLWHLENTKGFSLATIKYLVMDEADRLFSMDFEEELNAILAVCPADRNTFLFSATMTDKVEKLQRASLRDPVRVQVSTHKYQTVATLIQNYLFIPAKYKDCYLAYLMSEFAAGSTIIFVTTGHSSIRVALLLRNLGFTAVPINGKMTQGKRLAALNKFKSGERSCLVATDVAARGLDIPHVDLVLNFELPVSPKDYVHRVGRTARAGSTGRSISFVTQYDVENFQRIESFIEQRIDLFPTEEEQVMVFLERVSEAQRFAALQVKELEEREGRPSKSSLRNDDEQDDAELASSNLTKIKRTKGGRGRGPPPSKKGR